MNFLLGQKAYFQGWNDEMLVSGSVVGLVYLPTFIIEINKICRCKYTVHPIDAMDGRCNSPNGTPFFAFKAQRGFGHVWCPRRPWSRWWVGWSNLKEVWVLIYRWKNGKIDVFIWIWRSAKGLWTKPVTICVGLFFVICYVFFPAKIASQRHMMKSCFGSTTKAMFACWTSLVELWWPAVAQGLNHRAMVQNDWIFKLNLEIQNMSNFLAVVVILTDIFSMQKNVKGLVCGEII